MTNHDFKPTKGDFPTCSECGDHVSSHADKMNALEKKMMDDIIEFGHQVIFVFPTPNDPGHTFWYSVGRTVKDRPELLITGPLNQQVGQWMINEAAKIDDEYPLQAGQEIPAGALLDGYPVRVVKAEPTDAEMFSATSAFGEDDVTALQLVWPDKQGNFPGDPDYDERFVQPLFPVES